MAIDKDFLFLEDSRNHRDDAYGGELTLALEEIPPLAPGQPLSIRASVSLSGTRVPVIAFPEDPGNSREKLGVAIAAAVVIEDVEQDLDRLRAFEVRQQTANAIGGFIDLGALGAGTYALRLVVRTPNPGAANLKHAVRVATTLFTLGEAVVQAGLETVWLIEDLGPRQSHRSRRARLRHLGPGGQLTQVENALLHAAQRLPLNFAIEKRAISVAPDSEDSLFLLSALDDGRSRLFEAESDGSFSGPEAFDFDSHIFSHSTSIESWVWNDRALGRYFGGALVEAFDRFRDVKALAGVADSTVWAICSARPQTGTGSVYLRRLDENGAEIAEARAVSYADFETGAILRPMADGGVVVWGNYRGAGPHVVRVGPAGNVIAVSDAFSANVLDIAVNPYSGEALVVRSVSVSSAEIVLLNASLSTGETLSARHEAFAGAFESLISAEISAPPEGQRIWVFGRRRERQPSGVFEVRGAVGYLDQSGSFTFIQGGMAPESLLRALW